MRGVAVARRAVSAFFRHKPPLRLSTRRAASGWCWAFASRVTSPPTLQGLSSYALRRPVQLAAAARTAIPTRVRAALAVSSYGLLSRIRADQHQRRALHAEASRTQGSGSNKAGSGSGAGENAGTPRSTVMAPVVNHQMTPPRRNRNEPHQHGITCQQIQAS